MDRYDAAQVILQFIFDNEGTDTTQILEYVKREFEPAANLGGIGGVVEWLHKNGYINGTFTFGPDAFYLKPTEKGESAILSGKAIKELLSQKHAHPGTNVSNTYNTTTGNVGQLAQGEGHTLSQANITINLGDLNEVLDIMRTNDDADIADEVERLERSGDKRGAIRRLFERFTGKAVDATAGHAVDKAVNADYAKAVLPVLSKIALSVFG